MPAFLDRIHLETRDACSLVLRPWWAGRVGNGRVPERWTRHPVPDDEERCAQAACALFDADQVPGFVARQRAWRMAERADAWRASALARTQNLDALAAALPDGPALLLAPHSGSGAWLWPALTRLGRRAAIVAKQPVAGDFGHARVARAYGLWRGRAIRQAGCAGIIGMGGAAEAVQKAWRDGLDVLVLPDAPGDGRHRWVPAGPGELRVRTGAMALAENQGVRSVVLDFGGDPWTGARALAVRAAASTEVSVVAETFTALWTQVAQRDAASWPLWACGLWRHPSPSPTPGSP